jgi:hypothetical protein
MNTAYTNINQMRVLRANELTPWKTILLEKLVVNFPHFVEPKVSLPFLLEAYACPYPEPDKSNPHPHISFLQD